MTIRKASRPKPPKTRETSGPASELILYQTEDGRTRIECRFEDETIWLSQALMADLFQTSVQNVNLHILNILEDGEAGEATIKEYLIVRTESGREVRRTVKHYNLDMILAVGYRVRSDRGIAFRQWATSRLSEYLVKGFLLDDERLKNPDPSRPDYFDDVLERIRDIRSAEKRMYLKVKDIFALAADYKPAGSNGSVGAALVAALRGMPLVQAGGIVVARGSSGRVGSPRRGRLARRHCVPETSESCASLLASAFANVVDGLRRLAKEAPLACDPLARRTRSISGKRTSFLETQTNG